MPCLKTPKVYLLKLSLKKTATISCLILFALFSSIFAVELTGEFYPAKVKDISDRAYEPAVIELLDSAKNSIILSMYMLKPMETGPVRLLVKDLEEALDRGVSVEIYLNMRPDHGMSPSDIMVQPLQSLIKKGGKIYKFTPHTRLHDKLIIVDGRYVVDGSMNWSVAAIKNNYESAVLIDSPELAKAKLIRLRNFPLEGHENKEKKRPDRSKGLEPLPDGAIVGMSKELLNNKDYFAAMLKAMADRTMDTYLLILAESTRLGEKEFFIPLEEMAVATGMDLKWKDTELRRQVIKELRALQDRYKLIEVNFSYGKDAWVVLKELPDGVFSVKGDFFGPKNLVSKSQPAKFIFLMKLLLEAEGTSIDSFSVRALAKRFGISEFSIRKGLREIESY